MLVAYIMIYSIVDRICKCVEECATVNGYTKCMEESIKYEQSGDQKSGEEEN
jgi:hypothetical protein